MGQYDDICKYPKSEIKSNLELMVSTFLKDIHAQFDQRDNLSHPIARFPSRPSEEVKIPEIEHKLEVRSNTKKIVFSSIEEV